jgi:YidC/Oxa1 family membrane protein insertase
LLDWVYTLIAWVMKEWHALLSTFLPSDNGITWALAIVLLVVSIRVVLFPLFVKQIKSQRAMQEIQPEIQKLRKQYGTDKQGFSTAMMALQKERGVNPLAGCLPILPQVPVFISLLHVLRRLAPGKEGLYSWSNQLTDEAAKAKLFGAPISSSFNMQEPKATQILGLGVTYTNIRIVAFVLIIIMCVTTFTTQKQIQKRSGPVEGQAAMVQKLLLYGMPLSLFVSGFFFPLGVLIYWLTNNLWTLGQQFYVLNKMPPPGSPAHQAKLDAERPKVDPKALAPKPGQKPVRPRTNPRPATAAPDPTVPADGTPVDGGPTAAPQPDLTAGEPSADGLPPGAGNGTPRASGASAAGANRGKRKRR